ncbi:MAG TPA: methyl-accepting chemotaxis protein [Novosphingobium sp.]|nr:methyl-accepting chemotaxis protein [Novosphingobium sp.]
MEELVKLRQQGLRVLVGIAWLSCLIVAGGSFFAGSGVLPVVLAVALGIYPTLAAMGGQCDEGTRIVMGGTMPLYCAVLLYQWAGHGWIIDLHMTFFAAIAVLVVLADWRALVAGAGVTAVHHLLLNFVAPALVFAGGGDLGRVVLHAVVVVVETAVLVAMAMRLEQLLLAQVAAREAKERLEAAAAAERARREEEQETVVAAIALGLGRLAQGDLASRIEARFPAGFEPLRENYNRAIGDLDRLVGSVARASGQIQNGVREIRYASDDLARRTEQQAASVERATHTIGELVHAASETAARAAETSGTLDQSQQQAARGHAVVAEAMATMERIEQSAGEIGQIVSLIDGIAFQTNLLALNAGVEAARAGDSGRGFAVVAGEVRALAQRSAEAAADIKRLIGNSTAQVSEGVALVTQTGQALQEVMEQVTMIACTVSEITAAVKHNACELGDVREAFSGLDRSTQQNAAMVEESNAALQTLVNETNGLIGSIDRFKGSARQGAARLAA